MAAEPTLQIAAALALPLSFVTQRLAIFAMTGMGKTYFAAVFAEEMLKAGAHLVVFDPTGIWWGLRASADGEGEGLPITILGRGVHADLPITPTAGAAVADMVVSERLSVVLDLAAFDDDEQVAFANDFAGRLYQLKELDRRPLHLLVDEADVFLPQMPTTKVEVACRKRFDAIVRRGRVRGFGMTMVSQRPAVVYKNPLTQISTLCVLGLSAPQDLDPVDDWLKSKAPAEQRREVMASLSTLPVGDAWFCSPREMNVFQRVRARPRETFDSSKTPEMGEAIIEPKRLAAVDLGALRERLAATIEQAEQNDPAALRAKLADAQARISEQEKALKNNTQVRTERVEVPVLADALIERWEQQANNVEGVAKDMLDVVGKMRTELRAVKEMVNGKALPAAAAATASPPAASVPPTPLPALAAPAPVRARVSDPAPAPAKTPVAPAPTPAAPSPTRASLPDAQKRFLDTLADFARLGVHSLDRKTLAVWSNTSPTSSDLGRHLARLEEAGLVTYPSSGRVALTSKGLGAARVAEVPPSAAALQQAWLAKLPTGPRAFLRALLAEHANGVAAVARRTLAQRASYSPTSSDVGRHIATLKDFGLVYYPKQGQVAAAPTLLALKRGS